MFGVIDIGNTNIHCATCEDYRIISEEIINNPLRISDFFAGADEIILISVAPEKEELIKRQIGIPIIKFPEKLIEIKYESVPGEDRLSNGLAVSEFYSLPSIVIDCGSAITVDIFRRSLQENEYMVRFEGGAIMPGLNWYFASLSEGRKLPGIEPGFTTEIGGDTESCIKFGAYGAMIGGIREILGAIDIAEDNIIITGGDGAFFNKYLNYREDSSLTLKGGVVAYNKLRR